MIIDALQIYRYALGLNKPLYVGGHTVNKREGFILKISAKGACGFGDIAPLEGLSHEGMDEALQQLKSLQKGLLQTPLPEGLKNMDGGFKKWVGAHKLASSVQFGLELAVLNLLASAQQTSMARLISDTVYTKIQINGFLCGNKEEVKAQARQLIEQGYHSLKLKVNSNIEEAVETVLALNTIIEGRAVLHVDANQSWNISQAVHFGHEVGLTTVDYIEEPFKNLKDIGDFFMKTTIPTALDESLRTHKIDKFKMIDGLEVLVLKPTILGGIETCYHLIQQARTAGLSTVISSCYESSIGILGLANLAGICSRHQGAGLDTLKFFQEDVLKTPAAIEGGKMDIETHRVSNDNINYPLLKEIPA